jgi:twinkle protein
MKIISLNTKTIYEIEPQRSGENNMQCPECSKSRKKQKVKCFSWNNEKNTGYCNHCNTAFVQYKPFKEDKKYFIPQWKNITDLTDKAVKYFTSRMISQETLNKMKIYSDKHYMSGLEKEVEVICFPYFFEGNLKNIKYRGAEKTFQLVKEAELLFYNIDCVFNFDEIIIVEGEFDCLSFIEIGYDNCVSVPNGARFNDASFIDNYIEIFNDKKIIIAVDNDLPGTDLKNELIRRFGAENCKVINFEDCKDANEVLINKGGLYLRELIKNAKEIQLSGIINLDDNYNDIYNQFLHGLPDGKKINCKIDELLTWEKGRLVIWSGIPSHGKSEAVDYVNVRLNLLHGWKVAYFSPENFPVSYHYSKIAEKIAGKAFKAGYFDEEIFNSVYDYIKDNFFFIYPEDNFKYENILEKAKYLIKRRGIDVLVIDPYNNLEHLKSKNESETEYINRFLGDIRNFGKRNNILIHLIAHPTKMKINNETGLYYIPTLYDINGSANFYNRADYGIIIYRYFDENNPKTLFIAQKVKFKHWGRGGTCELRYNYNNGRFESIESMVDMWDNSNWLSGKFGNETEKKDFWYDNEAKEIPF